MRGYGSWAQGGRSDAGAVRIKSRAAVREHDTKAAT
jgi:hypothetical protein